MTSRTGAILPRSSRALLLAPKFLLIGSFFWALAGVIGSSFVREGTVSLALYKDLLSSPVIQDITLRTIWISLAVTAVCLLFAYPIALFISRSRHTNLLLVIVISPWLTSLVVRTFAWMVILGNRGALNSFLMSLGILDAPVRIIFTPSAVVLGLAHIFIPFMVISILSVLQQQDRHLTEAGMSLGAGPIETFARVTLPLSLPGVLSGSSIVYMLCSGAIVTPLLLGGVRDRMLGTQIYQELVELYDYPRAAGIAVILLVTSLIVIIPLQLLEARIRQWTRG